MCKHNGQIELCAENGDSVRCRVADSFLTRLVGLMGKKRGSVEEALLIRPCNSIHMFFMRFAIDVVFLDREMKIVRLIRNLAPGRIVGTVPGAWQALEAPAGSLPESFREGIRLTAHPV